MSTNHGLRTRRSEAQLHALAGVEREIHMADPSRHRKYLREFGAAFRSYDSVINGEELNALAEAAELILIGDYHALPACQRYAAALLEQRSQSADRPVILAVETIFARDQHILDEWWRREIDEDELRKRIRFDLDWGYDWTPFYELLITAREHAEAIYGLDCMPREDLRKIGARDRHAAHKLRDIRHRHPNAVILVLFGESHLAPGHLPRLLHQQMPGEKILTILQNVDALYWLAAGEKHDRVEAVRVSEDTVCVFNSTPLEKYEHYRLHLSRWGRAEEEGPDLAPTIYNLIDGLLRFLGINLYASCNGAQPRFLVDLLPEVFSRLPEPQLLRLLQHESDSPNERARLLRKIEEHGSAYLPRRNVFYVQEFQMMPAAEEVARFLHNACRGLPSAAMPESLAPADSFHQRALEHALAYFGSRVLYPARPAARIDRVLTAAAWEREMESGPRGDDAALNETARKLGYTLGSNLYDKYIAGVLTRVRLRKLFLAPLGEAGAARAVCSELLGGQLGRKGPYSDHSVRARLRTRRA